MAPPRGKKRSSEPAGNSENDGGQSTKTEVPTVKKLKKGKAESEKLPSGKMRVVIEHW